jgi:NAD(P)-dependent dehydrogenase (short-subunit alcohol dehydrogenase family)
VSTGLDSFPGDGLALVIGATGGLGAALLEHLTASRRFARVLGLSRSGDPGIDVTAEASVAAAAGTVEATGLPLRLVVIATGFLHGPGVEPEKTWRALDPAVMAWAFAVNAIGPALLIKHFLPRLARPGKAAFIALSARVGSIGDNHLGGWYSYRASKAALNQIIRTAAVEAGRRQPEVICAALHPGTVATALSRPFAAPSGPAVQSPDEAARRLLHVINGLTPAESGGFFDHHGIPVPW